MINLSASSEPTQSENEEILTGGDHAGATERHNGTTGALADTEKKKKWRKDTVPSLRRGSRTTHTHRLALVHVAVVGEHILRAVRQAAEARGGGAAVRGEACGALGDDVA